MSIADVGFSPLQKKAPLIDDFNRLNVTKIDGVLKKLEQVLEKKVLDHFKARFRESWAGQGYHASEKTVKADLEDLEFVLSAYLFLRVSDIYSAATDAMQPSLLGRPRISPSPQDKPARLRTLAASLLSPSFADVGQRRFDKLIAQDIDRAEAQIDDVARLNVTSGVNLVEPLRLEEYVAWRTIIRLRLVICVVNSLNYDRLWRGRTRDRQGNEITTFGDGDAGWFLSERIEHIAAHLLRSQQYRLFEEQVYGRHTFLADTRMSRILNAISGLRRTGGDAAIWRNWCHLKGCSVEEIGNKHPWEFRPIAPELFTLDGKPRIPHPPHMYARKAAEARAIIVKNLWDYARERLLEEGKISDEQWYRFLIGAGTLKHGGAHPPHITHRDGSMFDMSLTFLPRMTSDPQALAGSSVQEDSPLPDEVPEQESEDKEQSDQEETGDITGIGIEPATAFEYPAAVNFKLAKHQQEKDPELKIPKEWQTVFGKSFEWRDIALKFSQCLFLSFPDSVIFAGINIMDEAKGTLVSRLSDWIVQLKAIGDEGPAKELEIVAQLISNIRFAGAQSSQRLQEHAGHWHVNYNPDSLGDESPIVRSRNLQQAQRIEVALDGLRVHSQDVIWKKLLQGNE